MAKTKISEWSSTSADNTDISNINIAEGCSPANVNNAIPYSNGTSKRLASRYKW